MESGEEKDINSIMIMPSISVIVVNWNGVEHLEICLNSIQNQTLYPNEIILVDNGSNDHSVEFVRNEFPSIKIIQLEKNYGFSVGNNIGINYAAGHYIALINNDTEADPRWLEKAMKGFEENPDIGFIASRICLFSDHNIIDTAGDIYFRSGYPEKRGWLLPFGDEFSKSTYVFGACAGAAIYKKEMLSHIGLFDEDYFNYQEDVDLSFRAQLCGFKCLYVPDAVVYHKVSATSGLNSWRKQYWSHRNHWFTMIKNLPTKLFFRYFYEILLSEILVFGSTIRQKRLPIFFKARIDVLKKIIPMIKKRIFIQKNRRINPDELDKIIQKNWYHNKKEIKKRETKFYNL